MRRRGKLGARGPHCLDSRRITTCIKEKSGIRRTSEDSVDPPTSIDRLLHASMGRFTLGLSPYSLWLAYADWAIHLWASPGKSQQLSEKGVRKTIRFLTYLSHLASDPACRALHRALAARSAVPKRGLAAAAVQSDLPGLSSEPAMVAQRHDRRRRRIAPPRAGRRVHDAPVARHRFAGQFHRDQS